MDPRPSPTSIELPTGEVIHGDLLRPPGATGLVVFAHGSGSSRFSPRNRSVAAHLCQRGLATLLLDMLTEPEQRRDDATREHRFDIALLAERVMHAVDWCLRRPDLERLAVGCFGASTGAGAALVAAARRPERVLAVVSRGGRPDLAGPSLPLVVAPTLLIVGGADTQVLELNRQAAAHLAGPVEVHVVPGATHLFEEPGALEEVQEAAGDWFLEHLPAPEAR